MLFYDTLGPIKLSVISIYETSISDVLLSFRLMAILVFLALVEGTGNVRYFFLLRSYFM